MTVETAFFKTAGGVIYKIDIPAAGNLREIHDEKVAKGLLTLVEGSVVEVERPDGSVWYEVEAAEDKPRVAKKTAKKSEAEEVPATESEE